MVTVQKRLFSSKSETRDCFHGILMLRNLRELEIFRKRTEPLLEIDHFIKLRKTHIGVWERINKYS